MYKKYKKISYLLIASFLLMTVMTKNSIADEKDMRTILADSLYGGVIGFVVGSAIFLFGFNNPEKIAYGTGAGVIAGTAYGIYTTTTSFTEYKDESLSFKIPTVKTVFNTLNGKKNITIKADIFSYTF